MHKNLYSVWYLVNTVIKELLTNYNTLKEFVCMNNSYKRIRSNSKQQHF